MNWNEDAWFVTRHGRDLTDEFKAWWEAYSTFAEDDAIEEDDPPSELERSMYWIRCGAALDGFRAGIVATIKKADFPNIRGAYGIPPNVPIILELDRRFERFEKLLDIAWKALDNWSGDIELTEEEAKELRDAWVMLDEFKP